MRRKSKLEMVLDALVISALSAIGGVTAVLIAPSAEAFRIAGTQVFVTFFSAFFYQVALERGLMPRGLAR